LTKHAHEAPSEAINQARADAMLLLESDPATIPLQHQAGAERPTDGNMKKQEQVVEKFGKQTDFDDHDLQSHANLVLRSGRQWTVDI
jgi:hypothetical protein